MLLYGPVDGYLLLLKDDWCFDYFPPNKYMYYLVKIKPVVFHCDGISSSIRE
jgi:hypothetical protein